jgi:hypothetical protein
VGLIDAAVGKRASYARGLSKNALGIPEGPLTFLKFESIDAKRDAKWNVSTTISGSEGNDRGTPGEIALDSKPKYPLTSFQLAVGLAAMVGRPTIAVVTAGLSWRLSFYPSRTNVQVGAWDWLFRGSAAVGGVTKFGHRCQKITMAEDSNKRIEVNEDWTDGTGDSISGFPVSKTGNAGTYTGRIVTRGRRPKDAAWTAGKSMYLKVTAKTASSVTFKKGYDVASPGDGTGFPAVVYDTATFTVNLPSAANDTDGFSTVIGDAGPVGNFGEDYQPLQVALSGTSYTLFAVNDEYEIPYIATELTVVNLVETRLSAFQYLLTLGGSRQIRTNKCTIEINRPYKAFKPNRTRYATAIDPSGNSTLSFKFDQRFFDNYLRDLQDANTRLTVYAAAQNDDVIAGTAEHEGVEIYAPQGAISALAEGAVTSPDVLMSNATVEAENPDSTVALGASGAISAFAGTRVWEIHITTGIDPTAVFAY